MADEIFIADKATLDKTKQNTDKIIQDTTYLRDIKSNNKISLKLENITNQVDINHLHNALCPGAYSLEVSESYKSGCYNAEIKNSNGEIIQKYYGEKFSSSLRLVSGLVCIDELDLLIQLFDSGIIVFNKRNWRYKEVYFNCKEHAEIVGFDWTTNTIIVTGEYYLKSITIKNAENLDININDTSVDISDLRIHSSSDLHDFYCLMYKKNNISYFIHYDKNKYNCVVTEYDSALTPNGIVDVLGKSMAKKSEYIITKLTRLGLVYFMVKPIEYGDLIIFQNPFFTIDTKQKKAMRGYGLDYWGLNLYNVNYYLINSNDKLLVLTKFKDTLFIFKVGNDLNGKCIFFELSYFEGIDSVQLRYAQYYKNKLTFYSNIDTNKVCIISSINIKELLDWSGF